MSVCEEISGKQQTLTLENKGRVGITAQQLGSNRESMKTSPGIFKPISRITEIQSWDFLILSLGYPKYGSATVLLLPACTAVCPCVGKPYFNEKAQ